MNSDKKIVLLAISILVISSSIMYILFFNLKWDLINFDNIKPWSYKTYELSRSSSSSNITNTWSLVDQSNQNLGSWDSNLDDLVWSDDLSEFNITWDNITSVDIKTLSWTTVFSWSSEIINSLNINKLYSLTDQNNILFHYLWTGDIDIIDELNKLWWNLVEIAEKKIIKDSLMFGDRVTYINLPNYKWIKTIFTVKFEDTGDLWLLEVDYNKYYKLKKYLRNLFNY